MSDYHRAKNEDAYYFFTMVTYQRRASLTNDAARSILKDAIHKIQND